MLPQPLAGRRVVDLSQYIAGSVCGQTLADFGADVEKVEPPGGDPARALKGTRFGSVYFRAYNTGKSVRALDLQDSDHRRELDGLLARADALVMNFGVRTLRRLNLDWDSVHDRHPHLVVTVISGYGVTDPLTCFDSTAQAVSGFSVTNASEDGRPAISAGYPTDVFSGLYAGMATAMALLDPVRTSGVLIDTPMTEVAMTALAGPAMIGAAEEGTFRVGTGNRDAATAPSNVYRCQDGWCYVYAGLDKHWALLRPVVGGDDAPAAVRLAEADRFDLVVEAWTSRHTVAEVDARMRELGIPAAPVRTPVEALESRPAYPENPIVSAMASGEAVLQFPVLFGGHRIARRPAPRRQGNGSSGGSPEAS